ncbi:integral membrane protein DUF1461 [Gottschalkia purinilytica]|uniref:Integral membrane protein DUF1461 n=1 Tax=Gottschalkia purinilytica TaxID=1503 RepID=A0A0L0WER4_GOTPU|nr:TIGR01906 family membrane protein [Gottschalkia purinilytica]KNF09957.1 integral membrane protein DUF1461 [Gottschalkia purinilytica]
MKLTKLFVLFFVVLLPVTLLLTTVDMVTFNEKYFSDKYEEYDISKKTGMNKEDLSRVTKKLLNYIKGEDDDIKISATINGQNRQVFNEKEILHMKDVKDLFEKGHMIRNISLIVVILCLAIILILERKKIGKYLMILSIYPLGIMGILALLMYIDFDKYFTYFHLLFFKNDLWLLDPSKDILIQMLPQEFFYSIAYKISFIFILELVILLIVGFILNKKFNRRKFIF